MIKYFLCLVFMMGCSIGTAYFLITQQWVLMAFAAIYTCVFAFLAGLAGLNR